MRARRLHGLPLTLPFRLELCLLSFSAMFVEGAILEIILIFGL